MSLIGLIVVTGIVVNDSILKIDTINRLRRREILFTNQSWRPPPGESRRF